MLYNSGILKMMGRCAHFMTEQIIQVERMEEAVALFGSYDGNIRLLEQEYDVKVLIDFINNILDSENVMNVAIIGMGHLGQAITNYFNGKRRKLRIVTAFDVDPEKVGSVIDDIPCYHMDQFEEVVSTLDVSIAVISSPTRVAPSLVVPIINAGIKGVLNFTSAPLNFPQGIVSENYDITTILEKVAYFVKEQEEHND